MKPHLSPWLALALALSLSALGIAPLSGCTPAPSDDSYGARGHGGSEPNGEDGADDGSDKADDGTQRGGGSRDGGGGTGATSGDAGSLGPSLPPDPNGFQVTIAPALDAQGCTECHHLNRPVDLTRYPFMAGTPEDTASRLIASLTSTMPPAPRDKAPQELIDRIATWKAAGMKP